jgi:membrane-associated phospholipid phosphatase
LQAALPSLHEAFATLVSVTLWPRVRNPFVRVLLVLYPLWMGFSLVLSGEHYVADLLLGVVYVVIVVVAWDRIDAWWDRRKAGI